MTERTSDNLRYSKVSRRIWFDAGFRSLSAPVPNGRDCFIRLLTAPEQGPIPGLFQAWASGIAESLGWSTEAFGEAFTEVEREGMALVDLSIGLWFLPNAIFHNQPESPNTIRGWRSQWRELPDSHLKETAREHFLAYCRARGPAWEQAFLEAIGEQIASPSSNPSGLAKPSPKRLPKPSVKALAKPSPNQEQEQDQEQEQERERGAAPPPTMGAGSVVAGRRAERKHLDNLAKSFAPTPDANPFPEDFEASPENVELAEVLKVDLPEEISGLRNHALSTGKRSCAWQADLQAWMKRTAKWNRKNPERALVSGTRQTSNSNPFERYE